MGQRVQLQVYLCLRERLFTLYPRTIIQNLRTLLGWVIFSQNAFPHSWSNLAPHGIMDALQILSKSFQHGGRNGCNAFSQSEKHREERRTGSQSPQDQSRWGDNRYFWSEGKLQSNFALKNFKSLSCGCTWRHLLIENLDLCCNEVRRNTLSISDNY